MISRSVPARVVRSVGHLSWMEMIARAGFAARGVVFMLIGLLAIKAAFVTGAPTGSKGALTSLVDEPFGKTILVLIGIGIVGFVIWRFIQAIRDPEHEGTDEKGIARRIGYVLSGVIYAGIAFQAFALARGRSSGADESAQAQGWTAKLMEQPFGKWLVVLVGLIIIGIAIGDLVAAWRLSYMKELRQSAMDQRARQHARLAGRIGHAARGVVGLVAGGFLVLAGLHYDPSEARGLGGSLQTLHEQAYGPYLLGAVALGLIAFGVFQIFIARYRAIPMEKLNE